MTEQVHERVMRTMADVITNHYWDRLGEVFHPDAVYEIPQSREVFRGLANIRSQFANYPGLEPGTSRVEDVIGGTTYALTPSYTVVAVKGSGDSVTGVVRIRYPDGSWWFAVNLVEIRDGLVARVRVYFAPDFPAPDWRAPYREPIKEALET
jgi:ketosteroid isomerase-like protein